MITEKKKTYIRQIKYIEIPGPQGTYKDTSNIDCFRDRPLVQCDTFQL